jgi:hypothetical protein
MFNSHSKILKNPKNSNKFRALPESGNLPLFSAFRQSLLGSQNYHVGIPGDLSGAENLDAVETSGTQRIDPQRVFFSIKQRRHPMLEPLELLGVQIGLEDRKLNSLAEVLEHFGHLQASVIVSDIIADRVEHFPYQLKV